MIVLWVKTLAILTAAASMSLVGFRHREWRGGLLLLSCVFFAAGMNEFEWLFQPLFPMDEPELPPIVFFLLLGVILAWCNCGTTATAIRAICKNRRFPLLVWGLCLVSFLPQLGTDKHVWAALFPASYSTREARELVEHGIEFLGYLFLLNWSMLFLRDKWRILTRRVPSSHEHLLNEMEWERVGFGGSRRNCYKLGESGFCVKFYKPPEECVPDRMKKSILRDIGWRRFNKYRNSSSEEVYLYGLLRHNLPQDLREKLPEVCERVYHPDFGWGVLETFYANPDGEALLPYEFEIERQKKRPDVQREIYVQARDFLLRLIRYRAYFHEPGNFHVQFDSAGNVRIRLIDFEPESKTLVPLELISSRFRQLKLKRKAIRYLAGLRARFLPDVSVETEIG